MMIICEETFEGPLSLDAPGAPFGQPGVYVIVCDCTEDGARRMVDCSASPSVGETLNAPANYKLWKGAYPGRLSAYVWYAPDPASSEDGDALVERIRERYHPWCNRKSQP